MKLTKAGRTVLRLQTFLLIGCALLSGFFAAPGHVILGCVLGGLAGSVIPGFIADFVLRRRKSSGDVLRMIGAVHANDWITNAEHRAEVEHIRGRWIAMAFGLIVAVVFAGYVYGATIEHCYLATISGVIAAWLLSKMFE